MLTCFLTLLGLLMIRATSDRYLSTSFSIAHGLPNQNKSVSTITNGLLYNRLIYFNHDPVA